MSADDLARLADLLAADIAPPELLAQALPEQVGRYQVLALLGEGAHGRVLLARDPELGREVAIKLLAQVTPGARERFRQEMQVLAALDHPNVIRVYDAGVSEGRPYFVMEHRPGGSLAEARLTLRQTVRVLEEAAEGCHAAHQRGVIHRDLKPSNILVGEPAVVVDLGVARVLEGLGSTRPSTQAGALVGTPSYMAPEQVSGGELGPWTDVHALGVLLYEALCGQLPFQGTLTETVARIAGEVPRSPRELEPGAPPLLARCALRALAKAPQQRHASAAELAAELRAWRRGAPPARSGRAPLIGAGVLGLALAAGLLTLGGGSGPAETPASTPTPQLPSSEEPEPAPPPVGQLPTAAPAPPAPAVTPPPARAAPTKRSVAALELELLAWADRPAGDEPGDGERPGRVLAEALQLSPQVSPRNAQRLLLLTARARAWGGDTRGARADLQRALALPEGAHEAECRLLRARLAWEALALRTAREGLGAARAVDLAEDLAWLEARGAEPARTWARATGALVAWLSDSGGPAPSEPREGPPGRALRAGLCEFLGERPDVRRVLAILDDGAAKRAEAPALFALRALAHARETSLGGGDRRGPPVVIAFRPAFQAAGVALAHAPHHPEVQASVAWIAAAAFLSCWEARGRLRGQERDREPAERLLKRLPVAHEAGGPLAAARGALETLCAGLRPRGEAQATPRARELLERATRGDPQDTTAWVARATEHRRAGDAPGEARCWKQVEGLTPAHPLLRLRAPR